MQAFGIWIYAIGLIFLLWLIWVFRKPFSYMVRILFRAVLGGLFFIAVNTFSPFFAAVNPVTAGICGIFGLPGALSVLVLTALCGQ